MNRYQILRRTVRPFAYRFKNSNSIRRVSEYMRRCIDDEVYFDASNMTSAIVDSALALLSKEMDVPILTDSNDSAKIFSITHGIRKVYSTEGLPGHISRVLCTKGIPKKSVPAGAEILLRVI